MKPIYWTICMVMASSCSSTEFRGENSTLSSEPSQLSSQPVASESYKYPETAPPSDAVRKGSFVAWTEPADPTPGENYAIFIQVDYGGKSTFFTESDLTGFVRGTDGYRQYIMASSYGNAPSLWAPVFSKTGNGQRVKVFVPGAYKMVRDTIQVHSQILSEKQVLEIVF